jgi:microcystin-dependent protein
MAAWRAEAQIVGTRVPYSGTLSLDGEAVDGEIDFIFSIYDDPDPTAVAIWSEEHLAVHVFLGEFQVILGSATPLAGLGSGPELFLGVEVSTAGAGYVQLEGRQPIGSILPQGLIAIWSGPVSGIPAGWALCDGSNGTPDLTSRFVFGASDDGNVGETGGQLSFSLATANLPSHTHSFSATSGSTNAPDYFCTRGGATGIQCGCGGSCREVHTYGVRSNNPHTHSVSGTTGGTGSGTAVTHVPPYFRLAYIMKI